MKFISRIWIRLITRFAWLFPARMIRGRDGSLYLARFILLGDGGNLTPPPEAKRARLSIFLHRFFKPDADRELHSHPWKWSLSIILSGGYCEFRYHLRENPDLFHINFFLPIFRRLRPFTVNLFRKGDFHRIATLDGPVVWTLFIAGPKVVDWGFLVRGRGVVPHETYFRERGEI